MFFIIFFLDGLLGLWGPNWRDLQVWQEPRVLQHCCAALESPLLNLDLEAMHAHIDSSILERLRLFERINYLLPFSLAVELLIKVFELDRSESETALVLLLQRGRELSWLEQVEVR